MFLSKVSGEQMVQTLDGRRTTNWAIFGQSAQPQSIACH
ncbi:MAG: hypothetical protein AVDCRST_MAG43-418 [uncultured Thermomicrobiales bacterium]|uniref:Uncharacterized protein n=1 Tax=uncultured Thermomicrobiales bacterium TaxID=1645740 RepID=A0A6J4UBT3_9BACT|nr:MAG: hypothetical protein AVDCRST_MAG43-418 [uncultured Thermomicrobiales bacterium]